jgi:asparagine synthase (glutamine-hydrolysing)
LRDWAQAQIDDQRLAREGYFHPAPVREAWNALLRGDSRQQHKVWAILMFQSWLDAQQLGSSAPSRPAEAIAG